MSEVYKKLRALEGRGENSTTSKPVSQESTPGEEDDEAGGFRDEADQLCQTISTLEAEWETLHQDGTDLQEQLEESTSRLEVLSQEVAARDRKLKEINQNHETSVKELKRKIEEAQRNANTLIARKNAAKAQKKVAEALAGVGEAENAFAALKIFEESVARDEAAAKAYETMAGEADESLEEEFAKLDTSSVDDELEKLKKEMGK